MKKIRGIYAELVDAFNEAARSTYPEEFLSMMREDDGIISELVLIPGTVYGDSHSFLSDWMAPVDFSLVGTVHSHPGHSNEPSEDDLQYFSNYGGVHIITCMPFDRKSWKAYNSKGEALDLELFTDS
ncbi:MAG: Mov34/MPN/PAD-1 family protein [Candidatus Methanomethylophilaceae archaeon]|jgi:proteasome lid subunit RPN8/RPN11|nr:Mov34/MPN/PAD-1 family protein [Candidatus Methanomethylophilaceae archaeon]